MKLIKYLLTCLILASKILLTWLFVHPKKQNTNAKLTLKVNKVLVIGYPHFNVQSGLKGGDNVVNQMIIKLLQQNSIVCEQLEYNPNFKVSNIILKKLIGMPYIFSQQINSVAQNYDTVLVDAMVNFNIQHSNIISLFHYSFLGYKTLTGAHWKLDLKLFYSLQSLISKLGNRNSYNVAVSEFQKYWLNKEGIKINKIIQNAVDTNIFKLINKQKVGDCLFLGGFGYYGKGVDVLNDLASLGLDITCVTNGNLPASKLKFLPAVSHDNVPEAMNNYKIFLYPTRYDSNSLAVLEAMACGLPVITGNVGIGPDLQKVIPEFVVNMQGQNVVAEYESKIKIILNDLDKYSKLALNYVTKYHSIKKFNEEWLEVIKS